MKPDIHPNYRPVVFKDNSADFAILTRSTVETKETITWTDGKEYPLVRVDISSQSPRSIPANRALLIPPVVWIASNANTARNKLLSAIKNRRQAGFLSQVR